MRLKLHHWIFVGMLVGGGAGLAANGLCPQGAGGAANPTLAFVARNIAEPIGQVFLRLIYMIALPLVFCALALGVVGMGDIRKVGRVGLRTLGYTVLLSSFSVLLGVTLAKTIRPGEGLPPDERARLLERYNSQTATTVANARAAKSLRDTLLDIIPKNPLQEMVGSMDGSSPGGGMLAVMFFALVFGIALTLTAEKSGPVVAVLEGIYAAVMRIIDFAMRLAPIGVAGLMFSLTAMMGLGIVKTLGWFVVTVLAGLSFHLFVVYGVLIAVVVGMKPWRFFGRISEAMLTALATSSSSATLPTALRVTQERLGVHREISGFVLTVGSTANQNGTALYEGVIVLFLAQVFGVSLDFQQQVVVVLMSVLAGVGTAGIPGGALPMIVIVLQSVGVPGEGIGIILGVDRLLDMCRTVVNVTGDIVIAACVDRGGSISRRGPYD